MKKIILSTLLASTLAVSVNADFLGAEAGYALWQSGLTGNIQNGTDTVDFEKDLGFTSSADNSFIWAYVDHPFPFLPNLKIQKTNYSDSATGTLNRNFSFAKTDLVISENATSEFTLDQTDVILYWRLLDNWVNLDIGFGLKNLNGNMKIDTTRKHIDEDFSVAIPLGYAKARFDLPFSGISVETDISTISYNGNKFSDIKTAVVYETFYGLGATAGYRAESVTLDDINDITVDIEVSGMYVGVFYHF
jgi:outer membrane protein